MKEKEIKENIILIISGGIINGYEEYWSNIKKELENNRIEYIFLGFQKDIHKIYNSLDILVLPSLSEGLPRSLIEGMSHEIPVIANNVGGVAQIIKNYENGFLEEPYDEIRWTNDLKKIILDKNLREKMGKNAKEFVTENFSLNEFENKILKEFN